MPVATLIAPAAVVATSGRRGRQASQSSLELALFAAAEVANLLDSEGQVNHIQLSPNERTAAVQNAFTKAAKAQGVTLSFTAGPGERRTFISPKGRETVEAASFYVRVK